MDTEQYMENKEEDPQLHEDKPMESMPDTTSQDYSHNRRFRNPNIGHQAWLTHARHTATFPNGAAPKLGERSTTDTGSRNQMGRTSQKDRSELMGGPTKIVLLFCFLISVANIAMMGNMHQIRENHSELRGGDYVQACPEYPKDETCFEVRDSGKRLVYRMGQGKRTIGFSTCSDDAPETPSLKCVGELAFSQQGSSIWNYRLYRDVDSNKYSIVAGPHDVDLTDDVFRVRHMLHTPYNWVISKDAIPQDDYPKYGLYIKGQFLFDDSN